MARHQYEFEVTARTEAIGVVGWTLVAVGLVAVLVAVLNYWNDHDTKAEAACQVRSCYSTGSKPVLLPSGGSKSVCVCMEAPK